MKRPKRTPSLAVSVTTTVLAAFAALTPKIGQAQTLSQLTNGLVGWYPLDFAVTNGSIITTPDYVGARDMILVGMNGANVLASTRPSTNSTSVSNCFNFSQAPGTTIMYYDSKGQNALDGSGDFLPF